MKPVAEQGSQTTAVMLAQAPDSSSKNIRMALQPISVTCNMRCLVETLTLPALLPSIPSNEGLTLPFSRLDFWIFLDSSSHGEQL